MAWRPWTVLALVALAIAASLPGTLPMRFLAGLLLLAALAVGLSALPWRKWLPPLPPMPGLFQRPGPDQRWCSRCGRPAPRGRACPRCGVAAPRDRRRARKAARMVERGAKDRSRPRNQ